MDEAFWPLAELVPGLLPQVPPLVDDDAGVRLRLAAVEVDSPVELDVRVGADGRVRLGGVPPLYHLELSSEPVLHQLRLTAVVTGVLDDDPDPAPARAPAPAPAPAPEGGAS